MTTEASAANAAIPSPEPLFGSRAGAVDLTGAPEGTPARVIARLYEQILGLESVDVDADFFALGGHSLNAMQLLAAVNEAFSVELQFGDLIDKASPRVIAQSIGLSGMRGEDFPVFHRLERSQQTFITRSQLLFWRLGTRPELASYFNLRSAVLLHGPLDVEALRAALQTLVDRHQTLRMHFRAADGCKAEEVELVIPQQCAVTFATLEPAVGEAPEPREFMREQTQRELDLPFNLRGEPLVRFKLVRFSPMLHGFLMTVHHLVTDAWSDNMLKRELNQLYSDHVQRRSSSLPAPVIQYADVADWNRRLHQGESYRKQLRYWDELFASLGPVVHDRRSARDRGFERSGTAYGDLSIGEQDFARVVQRSAAYDTTPNVLLQTVMHLALYRTFRELEQMLVLTPSAGRQLPELQNSVGLHVTIIGVVSTIVSGPTLREFVAQIKRNLYEALQHHESRQFSLYDLSKHPPDGFPLFVYNYIVLQNDSGWAFGDLQVEQVLPVEDRRPFVTLLELYHGSAGGGLWGLMKYDLAQFGDDAAASFVADYRRILEGVLSGADDTPVAGIIGR